MEHLPVAKANQPENAGKETCCAKPDSRASGPVHLFRELHQRIGNRAVGRHIQAKLTVSEPHDPYEQEADRVADQIMRMPDQLGTTRFGTLARKIQRACAGCDEEEKISRQETPSEEDGELDIHRAAAPAVLHRSLVSPFSIDEGRMVEEGDQIVQTKSNGGPPSHNGVASLARVEAATSSPGTTLPDSTRTFMESRFRHDFGGVRIHADDLAAEAAESVNARAFTLGHHVVFGRGQYAPESEDGRRLLAHEFTHVIQQARSPALQPLRTSKNNFARPQMVNRGVPEAAIQRIAWGTARDTGRDTYPWGTGPVGDVYQVETDAGNRINAWKPHDGQTYWCHGYTFGGFSAAAGPFSIWGQDVPTVLSDDGWQRALSCMAGRNEILVFAGNNVAHSGLVDSVASDVGVVNEDTSMLESKWGQLPLNTSSWTANVQQYGAYAVYSKSPPVGVCAGKGANES